MSSAVWPPLRAFPRVGRGHKRGAQARDVFEEEPSVARSGRVEEDEMLVQLAQLVHVRHHGHTKPAREQR